MFSFLNRIRARAIVRLLLVLTMATFVCALVTFDSWARSPRPHAVAGDADDLGGIRDPGTIESSRDNSDTSSITTSESLAVVLPADGAGWFLICWSKVYLMIITR
jgi:hypothetical protein